MHFIIGFKGTGRSLFLLTLERPNEVVDLVYCKKTDLLRIRIFLDFWIAPH